MPCEEPDRELHNHGICPKTKFGYLLLYVRPPICSFVRPSGILISYTFQTNEDNFTNFTNFSGVIHYVMSYCTFFLLIPNILGFYRAKYELCHYMYGGGRGVRIICLGLLTVCLACIWVVSSTYLVNSI